MAANPGDLNAFKAANLPNTTDFTIRLGRHQWQVHSKIVSEASQFFRVACTGNFKESSKREVELHDDSLWAIARLIQFFYLGSYDASLTEGQHSQTLSVVELVFQGKFPCAAEKKKEEARTPFEIDTLMWDLANKYNSARLREHIADKLIMELSRDATFKDRAARTSRYIQVLRLIRDAFHEMPRAESQMVAILLDIKSQAYNRSSRSTAMILPISTDRQTADEILQGHVFRAMNRNAIFATKVAQGLERLLDNSMQTHNHSGQQIATMKNRAREP